MSVSEVLRWMCAVRRGHWCVPFLSRFRKCAVDLVVFVSKAGTFDGGDVDVAVLPGDRRRGVRRLRGLRRRDKIAWRWFQNP